MMLVEQVSRTVRPTLCGRFAAASPKKARAKKKCCHGPGLSNQPHDCSKPSCCLPTHPPTHSPLVLFQCCHQITAATAATAATSHVNTPTRLLLTPDFGAAGAGDAGRVPDSNIRTSGTRGSCCGAHCAFGRVAGMLLTSSSHPWIIALAVGGTRACSSRQRRGADPAQADTTASSPPGGSIPWQATETTSLVCVDRQGRAMAMQWQHRGLCGVDSHRTIIQTLAACVCMCPARVNGVCTRHYANSTNSNTPFCVPFQSCARCSHPP